MDARARGGDGCRTERTTQGRPPGLAAAELAFNFKARRKVLKPVDRRHALLPHQRVELGLPQFVPLHALALAGLDLAIEQVAVANEIGDKQIARAMIDPVG